ncbi:hypothetical protein HAX54_047846, partial [Datura stramonium]|nr:hypothetical protein [Datura stramonium]
LGIIKAASQGAVSTLEQHVHSHRGSPVRGRDSRSQYIGFIVVPSSIPPQPPSPRAPAGEG